MIQNINLRDYNNSTPVKRKIKSPVVKLINNEVQTSKLEDQIKDFAEYNRKMLDLEIKQNSKESDEKV